MSRQEILLFNLPASVSSKLRGFADVPALFGCSGAAVRELEVNAPVNDVHRMSAAGWSSGADSTADRVKAVLTPESGL